MTYRGDGHWGNGVTGRLPPARQEAVMRNSRSPGSDLYLACCACAAGGKERLCGCYGNQEKAALLNHREIQNFGWRKGEKKKSRATHAHWGL